MSKKETKVVDINTTSKEDRKTVNEIEEDIRDNANSAADESSRDRRNGKEVSLKQQLKNHTSVVSEVVGYSVLSRSKDGQHAMATTYPKDLSNLIYLFHTGAITKHEALIINVIVDAGLERLKRWEEDQKNKSNIIKP